MLTKIQKLEKFFIAYLLINPLLDLFGGIYLHIGSTLAEETLVNMITPVLPLRMVVLLLFAVYALLITDKQTIFTLLPIGGAWLLSLAGEFLFATEFSLFSDMQYIAKYVYNLAVLLVYWRVLQRCQLSKEQILAKLNWYIAVTLTILSGSILLAYVFGLGYATYGDRWGISGSRGFFYSGNDITAILMLLLPLSIAAYLLLPDGLSRRQKLFWLFPPAGTIAAMLIISTKTSFLAIGIVVLTFLIFTLVEGCKTHGYRLLKRFGVVMLSFSVVFLVITLFSQAAIFLDLSHSIKKLRLIREGSGLDGLL
ncbi:MAG: O-antigen ligase family protein, partial [Clostridiales bacterium]